MCPIPLRNLAFLTLVFVTGCSDTPNSIFRSALNAKNEFIDSLMRVVDEKSAADFDANTTKAFRERLTSYRDKLDKWAINQSWTWVYLDPQNENSKEFILKAVKRLESKKIVEQALDETKAYLDQEEKNLGRIRHEVKRLENRIAQLDREKGGTYPVLTRLANEEYYRPLMLGLVPKKK